MIERAFTRYELPSLVEAIFSSGDEDDTIRSFHGNDVQTFIDVMDEARSASARHCESVDKN